MSNADPLFVESPPDWGDHSPVSLEVVEPPAAWQGLAVEWQDGYAPEPVFMGQCRLPNGAEAFVFGARFDTVKATIRGRSLPEGHFVEYLVAECSASSFAGWHRLYQKRGVVYSVNPGKGDHVSADDLSLDVVRTLSPGGTPLWKRDDAEWPTLDGSPMVFVAQFNLPETKITKNHLTWDKRVFLFWQHHAKGSCFKITTQDMDYESASDHYATE